MGYRQATIGTTSEQAASLRTLTFQQLSNHSGLLRRNYFSSVMIARCFPRTNVSLCVRLRRLNLAVPEVYGFTTACPSGVVDFRSPSPRNNTTTSLSWKCIGVATPDVQV